MSNEIKKDTVSIIFGDSLAYGLHDKEYGGWVSRLRIHMDNYCANNYVINLAIPGQTSNEILNRMDKEINNRYNDFDDFVLIFSFGIKDSLLLNEDSNYINIFKENINKIITKSRKYTNKIYFIGLIKPNIDIEKRKIYNIDNVIKIDKCLENICTNNNTKYIRLIDSINKDILSDGLHPNSLGHKIIYEKILKEIYNKK